MIATAVLAVLALLIGALACWRAVLLLEHVYGGKAAVRCFALLSAGCGLVFCGATSLIYALKP